MPHRDEPEAPSTVVSFDLGGLLRQVHDIAMEASRKGARQGVEEALKAQETDRMLDSVQTSELLGFPSVPAFKMALHRNPELAALGRKIGNRWRFRRSDLEAWLSAHPRRSAKP